MAEIESMNSLRVLCLEDDLRDRELVIQTLRADGLACEPVFAKTQEEFRTALERERLDLIISDFSLPSFDGMSALALAQSVQPETPFLLVSGTIGEERAVESLKAGATDYILKEHLTRLAPAVRRALREAAERSKRKELEEQLRQSQKMEAIGQLAGGVAHDFNNLMAVVRGNTELVLMDGGQLSDKHREYLKQVTAASERAAGLTRQLLAFGRKQVMQSQPLSLNDLIGDLTKMLNRVIGEDIRLQCSYAAQRPVVQADRGMMEQVVVNLVVNARDAMPHGGQLKITTEKISLDHTQASRHPEAQAGEFVCLSVSDTGTGIASEHLPHIFEPFFTTKELGKGTGLGLATVYGIVKQHRGWVEVASQVGAGTTFKVVLPASEAAPKLASPQPVGNLARGGSERILLVEDDLGVRLLTRRVLEAVGYRVWEATTGREALAMWRGRQAEVDLLVTDIVMPDGVTGRELAEQMRLQAPTLKVIFISGYSREVAGKDTDFFRRTNTCFLQKPYPSNVLIDAVRRCLDGGEP